MIGYLSNHCKVLEGGSTTIYDINRVEIKTKHKPTKPIKGGGRKKSGGKGKIGGEREKRGGKGKKGGKEKKRGEREKKGEKGKKSGGRKKKEGKEWKQD